MLTIIAAVGENNELGKDNDLVWHLPDDFKRFKKLTTGHCIIMGRKTFESFPKPLPNRTHIVLTRDKKYKNDACTVVHHIEDALAFAADDEQPFIIGGGEIYSLALPYVQIMELTKVHGTFDVDTYFPDFDKNNWKLIEDVFHEKDEDHKYSFTYYTYLRK
ncbi:dihydrofolate reductase [Mesonia ostreae]|uniref:Dihydrofolate reductase n=1 Tax=Mesonia ostreae TaxID=861110 RepID=A0ABU2KM72_9FLAO|nr:dihydrofolate reductase [Mesonia ostreae]MDT0295795.1 dihydrofolate reductase [Mesonia ostreae]